MMASTAAPVSFPPNTVLDGKAYIGSIKDPKHRVTVHNKTDIFRAIVYADPKESFDYLDLKGLVMDSNKLIFYTTSIDKTRRPVSWQRCKDALKNKPAIGKDCICLYDEPLTFAQFAEAAYSNTVLTDSEGYNDLQARKTASDHDEVVDVPDDSVVNVDDTPPLPKPDGPACGRADSSDLDAVKKGIETAASMRGSLNEVAKLSPMSSSEFQLTSTGFVPEVASNVVLGDKDGTHRELTLEFWKNRALVAESRVEVLEEQIATKEDELKEMRAHVLDADNAKKRFGVNSDLAQVAVRETQALAAKSIIEGLKPQFSTLPKLVENIEALNGKLNALGDLPAKVEALQGLVHTLDNIPAMVTALGKALDDSKEQSIEAEDSRVSDSEEFLCSQARLVKLLGRFGFSPDSVNVDVPKLISSLGSLGSVSSSVSMPTITVNCDCGCGVSWTSLDTSKPPPCALGSTQSSKLVVGATVVPDDAGTEPQEDLSKDGGFLMNKINNNPSPTPLLPTPPSSLYYTQGSGTRKFLPGHGLHYLPGHGPVRHPHPHRVQHQQPGLPQFKRPSPFQDNQNPKKK